MSKFSWINSYANVTDCTGTGEEEARRLEIIGRTCYSSYDKITKNSYMPFLRNIIKNGHESVLEHGSATAVIITDRGTSHEIVRHRLASYSQESTRYVKYDDDKHPLTFIKPVLNYKDRVDYEVQQLEFQDTVKDAAEAAGEAYLKLIDMGVKPQDARHVLPNCTATTLYMTANYREWRHFFKMRCSPAAHPNIQQIACNILIDLHNMIPIIFDDIYDEFIIDD